MMVVVVLKPQIIGASWVLTRWVLVGGGVRRRDYMRILCIEGLGGGAVD